MIDVLRARIEVLEEVLRAAEHALTTLDGLTASDGLRQYSEALGEGLEHHVAWDCFVEETWKIDESKTLSTIKAALVASSDETPELPAVCDACGDDVDTVLCGNCAADKARGPMAPPWSEAEIRRLS